MVKANKEGQIKAPILRFKGFTDDWEQRELGKIADTYSGGTPQVSVKEYYSKNEIPFIRSSDIHKDKTELYISSKGLKNSSAKLVSKGHILYALYGATSGEVDIARIEGAINQAVLCINAHDDLNYFLMLFLSKNKDKIIRKYIQGGQGNLSASIIKKIKIFITSKLEETQVSDFIKKLSSIITLYERKVKLLTQIKKYLLDNLFAEKDYPNLRFKGFTDAWEQRKLKELVKLITKGTTPRNYGGNINFIKVENIENMSINPKVKISESEHMGKLKRSILKENDILFSIAGSLGKVGLVNAEILPANTNQALAIIRLTDNKKIKYSYIFNYLKSNYIQHFIRRLPSVGAQPNLSLKQINELTIKFPNYYEQKKISTILGKINTILTLYEQNLSHLKELKKYLLQNMFC